MHTYGRNAHDTTYKYVNVLAFNDNRRKAGIMELDITYVSKECAYVTEISTN
jgi:hypothetical protein